jgi:hypothetical protein
MQLAKCLVLVVASVLAGASTSDGASLQLRSQHSLESSLRSKTFQRAFLAKTTSTCGKLGELCTKGSDCCGGDDDGGFGDEESGIICKETIKIIPFPRNVRGISIKTVIPGFLTTRFLGNGKKEERHGDRRPLHLGGKRAK